MAVVTRALSHNREGDDIGVVIVEWPREADRAQRLADAGVPRLFLVAADVDPPPVSDCGEDWVRLPADERDIRVRLRGIAARAAAHPKPPAVHEGRIHYRGQAVTASSIDLRIAGILVDRFGHLVSSDELTRAAWPDGSGRAEVLRVHLSRLRHRVRDIGLEIHVVRLRGYILEVTVDRPDEHRSGGFMLNPAAKSRRSVLGSSAR